MHYSVQFDLIQLHREFVFEISWRTLHKMFMERPVPSYRTVDRIVSFALDFVKKLLMLSTAHSSDGAWLNGIAPIVRINFNSEVAL